MRTLALESDRRGQRDLARELLAPLVETPPDSTVAAELQFAAPLPIDRMVIQAGYLKSAGTLFGNSRPAVLDVHADGRHTHRIELPEFPENYLDGSSWVDPMVEFDRTPVKAVRITLTQVRAGKAADACLSGVSLEVADE